MTDNERRASFIQGLRDAAAFFEEHPSVPVPGYTMMNAFITDKEEMAQVARGASWEKVYNDVWFSLRRTFGDNLCLDLNMHREVICRRVVTGTKVVPAQPERTVEEVEWVCDDGSVLGAT